MRINLGAIASSIANKFSDTFNRTDNSSELGRAADGSLWTALRGVMTISSNKASTSSSVSNYPAATITVPSQNVDITLNDAGAGTGALLWVTDADNWWAVDSYKYVYSSCNAYAPVPGTTYYACGNYYSYTACDIYNYITNCCGGFNVRGTCNGYNHAYYKNGTYCKAYNYNCAYYCTNQGNCASYYWVYGNNAYCPTNTYCSSSSTYYPTYLRILRSAAGSVSAITSAYLGDALSLNSIKVQARGTAITATAYSGTAQDGTAYTQLVYDATGASITPQYGIVFTPSSVEQHYTIDQVDINRVD